jgi:hypothetical protein
MDRDHLGDESDGGRADALLPVRRRVIFHGGPMDGRQYIETSPIPARIVIADDMYPQKDVTLYRAVVYLPVNHGNDSEIHLYFHAVEVSMSNYLC